MTNEEAVEYIRWLNNPELPPVMKPIKEAFNTAIKALKKQIPKKPLSAERPMSAVNVRCPKCERTFSAVEVLQKLNYCQNCGQRLDWSDEE